MIAYVLFQELPLADESDEDLTRPRWTVDLARDFCERANLDFGAGVSPDQITEQDPEDGSPPVIVAKLRCPTEHKDPATFKWRIIKISPTVSFVVEDEPALDEFTAPEPQFPLRSACLAACATLSDDDEDDDGPAPSLRRTASVIAAAADATAAQLERATAAAAAEERAAPEAI